MPEHAKKESLRIDRFMRLPRRTNETWQGGSVSLPWFSDDPQTGEPIRQHAIAWANLVTNDVALLTVSALEAADRERALDAFLDFGLRNRKAREGRPSRVEVQDASLGAFIKEALRDVELEVVVLPDLPRIQEEILETVRRESDGPLPPGALESPGVTVERMRSFADAARRLYERAPWSEIGPEDLVQVEAPAAPEGMACFVILDDLGDEVSLEFYASREQFEEGLEDGGHEAWDEDDEDDEDEDEDEVEVDDDEDDDDEDDDDEVDAAADLEAHGLWDLDYVEMQHVPVLDVGLWADFDLPVAGPRAYPVVIRSPPDNEVERPDASRLAFVEGLLRAVAETTEAEIDSGRWTKVVETAAGPVSYRLSIASLLDEPIEGQPSREARERAAGTLARFLDEGEFESLDDAIVAAAARQGGQPTEYPPPRTPAEEAKELTYRVGGARGRRAIHLLSQALALSPGCVEAYVQLGERLRDPAKALEVFERGRAVAERLLAPGTRDQWKGRFWEHQETRRCLRLGFGRASVLQDLDRGDEAAAEYRELMSLDEEDHAGAGYRLLALLLEQGRDEEAGALLSDYDDRGPEWAYGRTLWAYRNRSRQDAREALAVARGISPRVAPLLAIGALDPDEEPVGLAGPGDDDDEEEAHTEMDEAFECSLLLGRAWTETPGAIDWLAGELTRPRGGRRWSPRRPGRRAH